MSLTVCSFVPSQQVPQKSLPSVPRIQSPKLSISPPAISPPASVKSQVAHEPMKVDVLLAAPNETRSARQSIHYDATKRNLLDRQASLKQKQQLTQQKQQLQDLESAKREVCRTSIVSVLLL